MKYQHIVTVTILTLEGKVLTFKPEFEEVYEEEDCIRFTTLPEIFMSSIQPPIHLKKAYEDRAKTIQYAHIFFFRNIVSVRYEVRRPRTTFDKEK